jgi:hypothetical protein
MCQHTRQYVVVPARIFPHCIVVIPSAVSPSSKYCSTAQRMPLNQTKMRKVVFAGA